MVGTSNSNNRCWWNPRTPTAVESWNGSAWTETTEFKSKVEPLQGGGTGHTSDYFLEEAAPVELAKTRAWDGSALD